MRSIIASVLFICMMTGAIAETVNALAGGTNNSAAVTTDDNSDYDEIIKLFGEDDFAGYDDGYEEESTDSSNNNGTLLESYDLEKYLQDWKIGDDIQDSNLSCIVCNSSDQPSCKLSNQLDSFLTKCKVDQHYCSTTITNMSKGNSTISRRCSSE